MTTLISVFGGSRCGPDSAEYRDAVTVGRLLAEKRFAVACGGYGGVMEAVSRGAREAGGEVVGMTLGLFGKGPNRFVSRELKAPDLYERLRNLVQQSAGFIALRGGMGTVAEIAIVWNQFLLDGLTPRPLVLLGDCWPPVIESWKSNLVVEPADLRWIQFASSPADAVQQMVKSVGKG